MTNYTTLLAEAERQMLICNACRYCEGYCPVFPAMTLRRAFSEGDLVHLAHLCHNCKACYHACQYAPPHPFAVNVPVTFAELRQESYRRHAWPAALARAFEHNGTVISLTAAAGVTLALLLAVAFVEPALLWSAHSGAGAFFRIVPHWLMVLVGVATFGYAIFAMALAARSYLRAHGRLRGKISPAPLAETTMAVVTLRHLGGDGGGCSDRDDRFSMRRRWLHQALFGGFMLCFAATCTGAVYHHFFGWYSPHSFFSLPVQFGTWGGVLMLIGAGGLMQLKIVADPGPVSRRLWGGEFAMLALLFLIAASGLLLLALRHTAAMGMLLAFHLGLVYAFFLLLPYSKMVHGLYRALALVRHAIEQRRAQSLNRQGEASPR